MAPEHHFKFWTNDEVKPSLAWQIFRQGRAYEQMKALEQRGQRGQSQPTQSSRPRWQTNGSR